MLQSCSKEIRRYNGFEHGRNDLSVIKQPSLVSKPTVCQKDRPAFLCIRSTVEWSSCAESRVNLLGCFVALLVSLHLQPSTIGKERYDSACDEEDDAKHKHHTRVPGGPVLLSFGEQVNGFCLGPFNQADGGHGVFEYGKAITAVGSWVVGQPSSNAKIPDRSETKYSGFCRIDGYSQRLVVNSPPD